MDMPHNAMFSGPASMAASPKYQEQPSSTQFSEFTESSQYSNGSGNHDEATIVNLQQKQLLQQQYQQNPFTHQQHLQQLQQHHQLQHQTHQIVDHQYPPTQVISLRQSGKQQMSGSMSTRSNTPSSGHTMVNSNMNTTGISTSFGCHRGDLLFPDEFEAIEFSMPVAPTTSNGMGHGVSSEMLLVHGKNGLCTGEAFTERRRRGNSRRSNHKMEVEQQVKWSRKNIAATMERFEPTQHHSSSSTSSLEYGFAAGLVTPSSTPSHHISPGPPQVLQSTAAAAPYNHVYSYAYYEPGAAKCHTNIPQNFQASTINSLQTTTVNPSKSPPRYSIRSLLGKSFRSKSNGGASTSSSPSSKGNDERHSYTTRYGTTENLYEEVNDHKIRKVLSDNRIPHPNVKDEIRRVQHNHFRVLDQLNLSLEALIMPETPPDVSPNQHENEERPSTCTADAVVSTAAATVTATTAALNSVNSTVESSSASGIQRTRRGGLLGGAASSSSSQQRTLSHASLENLSSTLNSIGLKEHVHHGSCINPEFDEGDLDSGFSGSGSSSGASYNESLRYYKTGPTPSHHHHPQMHHSQTHQAQIHQPQLHQPHMHSTTLSHTMRSCGSPLASGKSLSKSSMASSEDQGIGMMTPTPTGCGTASPTSNSGLLPSASSPFNYVQCCSDTQRASMRSSSACSATGAKPKKNFWKLKP